VPALLSALQPRLQTLVQTLLRSVQTLLSALQPRLQALLRAARSVSPESALRSVRSAPESVLRWMRSVSLESTLRSLRSVSLQSLARDARRLARRPSRLTLGVAAGIVIVAAVLAGVSGGSGSPAAALDTARQAAPAAAGPVGHAPAVGQAPAAGHAPATGDAPATGGAPAAAHAPAGHAPAGHAPAGHAPAGHAATGHAAPSSPAATAPSSPAAAAPSPPAAPTPAKPYQIYDSVTPGSIPASQGAVASYADGPHPVSASQVAGRKSVLWISITGQDYGASVVDVEPGDATPAGAASWAQHRLSANPQAIARIYTMISDWPAVKAAVASLPAQMQARIHYWIADPTGSPHIVPGSDATQWYWGPNYDITTAAPGF
jgi:hypothetical protein